MTDRVDRADNEVRDQLRQLRVDPPDDGFELSLHRRLVEAGPPAPVPGVRRLIPAGLRHRWVWPLAGALAGAAVFLALTVLQPGAARSGGLHSATASVAVVPESKVAVVRLELTADVAVADADLRISLPEGLVFWSEGAALAERSFEWRQPLSKGKNEFPIAVRGQHPGVYRVRLTAQVGESSVQHDVTLAVVDG